MEKNSRQFMIIKNVFAVIAARKCVQRERFTPNNKEKPLTNRNLIYVSGSFTFLKLFLTIFPWRTALIFSKNFRIVVGIYKSDFGCHLSDREIFIKKIF